MSRGKKWRIAGIGLVLGFILFLSVIAMTVWYSLAGPEGKYSDSAGVRIHYTDEGAGTPVVLVHGFSNPAHLQWRKTGRIEALSKKYRVIALDSRGHGRSDKRHDPEQCGIHMVEDLVRLLDHLHLDKAHVVGYSMGGFITLKLTAMYPERLLSAAACGAGWLQPTAENRDFGEAVARAIETRTGFGPLASRLGLPDRPMTVWETIALNLVLTFFHDPHALAAVSRSGIQLSLTEAELRANTVPVLTIIGSEDGLLPEARALTETMAMHRLVVLEGRNHVNTDVAEDFLRELQDFLAAHTPENLRDVG